MSKLALDAFCLVEIFIFIRDRMRTLGINYDFGKAIGRKFKSSAPLDPNTVQPDVSKNESGIEKNSAQLNSQLQAGEKVV